MPRISLVAALLGAGVAAHAQTVTIYGIMDTGIERLTNINANGDTGNGNNANGIVFIASCPQSPAFPPKSRTIRILHRIRRC